MCNFYSSLLPIVILSAPQNMATRCPGKFAWFPPNKFCAWQQMAGSANSLSQRQARLVGVEIEEPFWKGRQVPFLLVFLGLPGGLLLCSVPSGIWLKHFYDLI